MTILRSIPAIGLLAMVFLASPAAAITAQQKMETCKFGADDQKLAGAERQKFITKCMAKEPASAKTSPKKKGAPETVPAQ